MDYLHVIDSLSPQQYARLQRAVELGKWPDGTVLTRQQRENALQAVIAWGERHLVERERVGYVEKPTREETSCEAVHEAPMNWVE